MCEIYVPCGCGRMDCPNNRKHLEELAIQTEANEIIKAKIAELTETIKRADMEDGE